MSKFVSALAFATLLSLPASAAANREFAAPRILVTNASCPAHEGYPDCHPDGSLDLISRTCSAVVTACLAADNERPARLGVGKHAR